jgi:hypothetical protein
MRVAPDQGRAEAGNDAADALHVVALDEEELDRLGQVQKQHDGKNKRCNTADIEDRAPASVWDQIPVQ